MNTKTENTSAQASWFVGASYGGTDDQLPRFLSEGIWENGYEDKHLDVVRSMRPGDRIAVKSSYTRKHGLPFESRGQAVSVMAIKAIGTITENRNDGKRVKVDWTKTEPVREWYFYTHRGTVWRVLPGEWMTDGLIAFAFDNKPQDVERFRNAPYWRERFGTVAPDKHRFGWTKFYEAIADKLLNYRANRAALVEGIREISVRVDGLGHLAEDKYADGTTGFVKDICPFTTMGLFNRGIKDSNRKIIATELAKFLGVDEPVPETFEGIPLLNNLKSWYFPFEVNRATDHIDSLWGVFAAGIAYADTDDDLAREEFAKAFDSANGRRGVAWNLTFGLYWIRPWAFLSLDHNSQVYVSKKLGVPIGLHGPKRRCNSADYLAVMDVLEPRFQETSYPVHSYPELSLEAWLYKDPTDEKSPVGEDDAGDADDGDDATEAAAPVGVHVAVPIVPYSVDDILKDGCFLERATRSIGLLDRLRTKKNLILQGPPGTGKTWLAKRLAFALMGQKDESKVRAVQFHPNLSYEDFVRGWRPTGEGKLSLADGVFMEAIKAASKDPSSKFVVVIEEINRGNPAQIFGELLTLLEAGKRTPNEALELCYPDADGKAPPRSHIPGEPLRGRHNEHRRPVAGLGRSGVASPFAFVESGAKAGPAWREWVVKECAVDPGLVADIERRIAELNDQIAADARLGKQFRIGHSYVTPAYIGWRPGRHARSGSSRSSRRRSGRLLDEYWFDAPTKRRRRVHG
jgi:5-methylcytosine-specific restriction protein B